MNPLPTKPNRWRPITVFNLLVGLLFSLSALAQPAFLKEGLLAYYPFNGNANDESGNAHNLLPKGVVFPANDRFGNVSKAFSFNGINSQQQPGMLKGSDLHLPIGSSQRTVTAWFKAKSIGTADVIYHWGGLKTSSAFYTIIGYGQKILVGQSGGGDNPSWGTIKTDQWYSSVLVYGVDGTARIYLNGSLVASGPRSYNTITDSEGFEIGGYQGGASFNGEIDDVRIYNRALSGGEVKALYDYESIPQSLNPRTATATAQVVNGFVVGATITDGGYGYVSNPVVAIIGGGGTGAKATATQFNGVVTSITITNPGSGYTSTPTITIAPPPFPPRKATSTAQVVNGFVVGTKITDGGFGYDSPPAVLLVGGGGSGATAFATVANGVVTAITIGNPGSGYTSAPLVRIASPPFAPKLAIETSKVYVRMSVVLGRKYQLEASTDLSTWTTTGPAFIAQDEELVQEFDVNQVGQYFRINQVP